MICAIWSALGFILTACFYFPPPRVNSQGLSRTEVLKQIDYIGGFLSISGMILFMMGMQWGGYQYHWSSAHVLIPLILGAVLLIAFVVWQKYARHPMFPKRLRQGNVRVLALTLIITFVSGANFFSILMVCHSRSVLCCREATDQFYSSGQLRRSMSTDTTPLALVLEVCQLASLSLQGHALT